MNIVTTLDKDLYDQAKVAGKIGSILYVAKLCSPEVQKQIEKNQTEMAFVVTEFSLTKEIQRNTRPLQNALQTLNALNDLLLHHTSKCAAVPFVLEELSALISLGEQRMFLLREQ